MGKKTWFRIHSFAGVITGLMLFVISWSGSFSVISHELDWLVTPEARSANSGPKVSWGSVEETIHTAYPEGHVRVLYAPLNRWAAYEVIVSFPDAKPRRIFVDPYTGEIQGDHSRYSLWVFFVQFHATLFLSSFGDYFVTVFSILLMISLVSALVFYKRWWQRFFYWPKGTSRAFWSNLHRSAGLWSIWFVAVIGVTGVWYLYEHGWRQLGGPVNYVDQPPSGSIQVPVSLADPLPRPLSLDETIKKAETAWPELDIRTVAYGWYSGNPNAVYLEGQTGFSLLRGRANQVHIDPASGEILWRNDASDLPAYWVWSNMADPLHFGNFGGLWSKSLYFVFGLILCGLILSGTWIHAHRLARETGGKRRHRWSGTRAAIFGTILIFFVSTGFGVRHAYQLGPIEDGVQQFPDVAPGVVAVIVAWIGLTLAILAAWTFLLWRPQLVLRQTAATGQAVRR